MENFWIQLKRIAAIKCHFSFMNDLMKNKIYSDTFSFTCVTTIFQRMTLLTGRKDSTVLLSLSIASPDVLVVLALCLLLFGYFQEDIQYNHFSLHM